jgi:aminoglycoside 3-N-acetyltransferase
MSERPTITVSQDDITAGLRALGVQAGDVILVHSSLSRFGYVEGGADAVIDALLDAVAPGGTVAVVTLTHGAVNASQPVFDHRTTPSSVGRIPETFRLRPEALRSLHPTHSCAAIGPRSEELLRDHERDITPCGGRSPYQRLMRWGGKIVFLGIGLGVNTSFHAMEELACVPWVFDRFEAVSTVGRDGQLRPVPSRRHTDGLRRDYEKMEPILAEAGALVKGPIGAAEVRVIDAAAMQRTIAPLLAEDPFLLLAPEQAKRERARYNRWRRRGM